MTNVGQLHANIKIDTKRLRDFINNLKDSPELSNLTTDELKKILDENWNKLIEVKIIKIESSPNET